MSNKQNLLVGVSKLNFYFLPYIFFLPFCFFWGDLKGLWPIPPPKSIPVHE
jgi:hypothetical protein